MDLSSFEIIKDVDINFHQLNSENFHPMNSITRIKFSQCQLALTQYSSKLRKSIAFQCTCQIGLGHLQPEYKTFCSSIQISTMNNCFEQYTFEINSLAKLDEVSDAARRFLEGKSFREQGETKTASRGSELEL